MDRLRDLTPVILAALGSFGLPAHVAHSATQETDVPHPAGSLDYAGLFVGLSFPGSEPSVHPSFGLDGGVQIYPGFGLGLFASYTAGSTVNNSEKPGVYTLLTEGNYFADWLLIGGRAGLKAGLAAADSTAFTFGPLVAYDYPTGNGVSVGGELSLLFTSLNSWQTTLQALVAVRYWF